MTEQHMVVMTVQLALAHFVTCVVKKASLSYSFAVTHCYIST